jgi:four helix bundle protein
MNDERIQPIFDIDARALAYAVRAVRLVRFLETRRDSASQIIARQLLRSAMSVGANLSEARSAETKRDFVHKCTISLKEARECLYWLRLLVAAEMITEKRLADFLNETDELIAILTTIIKRTKRSIQ